MIDWFVDSHAHASTLGLGYNEVVRRFKAAGGRLIALVQLTPGSYGLSSDIEGLLKSLEVHTSSCAKTKKELGNVLCIAGLHPAAVDRLVRSSRSAGTAYMEIVVKYMKRLEEFLREGLVDGLGEFGRPHFPAPPESWAINELLLLESLMLAKDHDVVVHIHSENAGLVTLKSIEILVEYAGTPRSKILVHHVPPSQAPLYTERGFYVSVVGRSEVVEELGRSCDNVLVESDYLDDPRRPGAVVYPWEIKREVERAVVAGRLSVECAKGILQNNPLRFFGIST